jgi:hypothetical protein
MGLFDEAAKFAGDAVRRDVPWCFLARSLMVLIFFRWVVRTVT